MILTTIHFACSANNALPAPESAEDASAADANLQVGAHTGGPSAIQNQAQNQQKPVPTLGDEPVIPHNGFATFEEGEKAFIYLLRKAGVDPTWTWEQTMRATITDPLYRALNHTSEKKMVFEKVCHNMLGRMQQADYRELAHYQSEGKGAGGKGCETEQTSSSN